MLPIVIVAILVGAIYGAIYNRPQTINTNPIDPELARAMEYEKVQEGDENIEELMTDTGKSYVQFDAFFLRDLDNNGEAEGVRGTCNEVGKEDTLYMELNVLTNGRLEDASIKINNDNFYFETTLPKDDEIKDNVIGSNIKEIKLNNITHGTEKLITGIVKSGDYTYSSRKTEAIGNNKNNYSKQNSVTLTGTHVNDETGVRTSINKTVYFDIDWYGKVGAEILDTYQTGNGYIEDLVHKENGEINLSFKINTRENKEQLILSKSVVEGTIPKLNNYSPKRVESKTTGVNFKYDDTTQKFTISREAVVNEQTGEVTNTISRNSTYEIEVAYPIDAYFAQSELIEIRVPVEAYYEGYNNTEGNFKSPEISNSAIATVVAIYGIRPEGEIANFEITVGKYLGSPRGRYIVSKEKPLQIYNEIAESTQDDNYIVKWTGHTGPEGNSSGLIMQEKELNSDKQVSDEFIKTNSQSESMEEIVTNVGIYFSNAKGMLGENGWIKVYDSETEELKVTFTAQNWDRYTAENPYKYEMPIRHVRVETSDTSPNSSMCVYNIKQIDDDYLTNNYAKEDFDEFQNIKSFLRGYLKDTIKPDGTYENKFEIDDNNIAEYEAPYAISGITISNSTISTQQTEKNVKITLKAQGDSYLNQVKWSNGVFLLKLPEHILEMKINSINTDNKLVQVVNNIQYEEGENTYIRIDTKSDEATSYNVIIDCDITPDPRMETKTEQIELYAYNENAVEYYNEIEDTYDLNGDLNTSEKITKETVSINMVSPNSLLTSESITNFNSSNDVVVAPNVAEVQKGRTTADINVEIKNNYTSTITDVKIVGKVPYVGNTYTINGNNMESTFNATMKEAIQVPDNLSSIVKVYYSTQEQVTNDVKDPQSGWTDKIEDFSTVKSYLIDFEEHNLSIGDTHKFTYTVNIPPEVKYNEVTYSHHGVYFSLVTDKGKYKTKTEPNKVGLTITKKYDLELIKYQKETENVTVPNATYSIMELTEEGQKGKILKTNNNGSIVMSGLNIGKTYSIKEVTSPIDYELNADEIQFTTTEEDGVLKVTTIKGNARSITATQASESEVYKVEVKVEDVVKGSIKVTKTGENGGIPQANVRFKVTGKNYEKGKTFSTNLQGIATLNGLIIGEEYTLEEIKATTGYCLMGAPIKFSISYEENQYKLNKIENIDGNENIKQAQIESIDNIPTASFNIEDKELPKFTLNVHKIGKEGEEPLVGVQFRLLKDNRSIGEYTTNGSGDFEITDLYQSVEGQDELYTLREISAPEGYSKMKDITFKVQEDGGILVMTTTSGRIKEQNSNSNTSIAITIENGSQFRLIKEDAETHTPIPDTKFAIYNEEEKTEPARDSKGELVGQKEEINGKEYNVLTTDDQGEITADLAPGVYKAVELEAPDEKYELAEDTYFGIGESREGDIREGIEWAKGLGGSGQDEITSMAKTKDGGFVVGGYFASKEIILDEEHKLTNVDQTTNGLIIKYDKEGKVSWTKVVGGDKNDGIYSIAETSDGGIIVGGYLKSNSINLGEGEDGQEIKVNKLGGRIDHSDALIIKYNSEGKVQWARVIGGKTYNDDYDEEIKSVTETSDGGYIAGGYFKSRSINLGEGINGQEIVLNKGDLDNDGLIIKYNEKGQVQWAKNLGSEGDVEISSIVETKDGGYVAGGYFRCKELILDAGHKLTNTNQTDPLRSSQGDGMIIKYSKEGQTQWAKGVGGTSRQKITSVSATSDGGIIISAEGFYGTVDLGEGTNSEKVELSSRGVLIIKYNAERKGKLGKFNGRIIV